MAKRARNPNPNPIAAAVKQQTIKVGRDPSARIVTRLPQRGENMAEARELERTRDVNGLVRKAAGYVGRRAARREVCELGVFEACTCDGAYREMVECAVGLREKEVAA